MAKYKPYNYSQGVLLPVYLEAQLIPGTLEFSIHTLVETRVDMRGVLMRSTTMMTQAVRPMIRRCS